MFVGHSLVRVAERQDIVDRNGYWTINMVLETCLKKIQKDGPPKPNFHRYDAYMYLTKQNIDQGWNDQIKVGRIIDVRYCEIEGKKLKDDGSWTKGYRLRLFADTRHTVPK